MAYSYENVSNYIESYNCELLTPKKDYKNTEQVLLIRCGRCGDLFEQSFSGFKNGKYKVCRKCRYYFNGQKKAKTTEEFKKEIFDLVGDEYEVLGEYKNARTKIKIKHKKCGHEYFVTPRAFVEQGNRCVKCGNFKKLTHEEFCKIVCELEGDNYTVLDRYKNSTTKIHIRHNKCGDIWYTTPTNFLSTGSRCPSCLRSKGEEEIAKILNSNGINYKEQFLFNDCKFINPLPFDFYLPDHNICIEYDGEQHYRPCGFGEKNKEIINDKFKMTQKRDKIKNKYCKENDIKLIRIPYYEFNNIENVLKDIFT